VSNSVVAKQPIPTRSLGERLSHRWLKIFIIAYGIWILFPVLAPFFMHMGWPGAGKAIYFIYSFFCHQLPERSFFLFGEKTMYSLNEIQATWHNTIDPFILRKFIGNETMGWKIAWSDRMISFYTSVWLFAIVWSRFRYKVRPLRWWGFVLFLLPLIIDGSTHAMSDFAGLGQGFRDMNLWLAWLTNHSLSATFYSGDALGSFNSIMRFITGFFAGLSIVWFAFPHLEASFGKDETQNKNCSSG